LLLINGIGASLEALEPFVTALDGAVEVIRFDPPDIGGPARTDWAAASTALHGANHGDSGTARRAGTSTSSAPSRAGPASRSCPGCGSRR